MTGYGHHIEAQFVHAAGYLTHSLNGAGTIDVAYGTSQSSTKTASGVANQRNAGPESSAITIAGTPAFGDTTIFRLGRDATTDTKTQDARLLGLSVFFTTDGRSDD